MFPSQISVPTSHPTGASHRQEVTLERQLRNGRLNLARPQSLAEGVWEYKHDTRKKQSIAYFFGGGGVVFFSPP
jgi:hypothetical protein